MPLSERIVTAVADAADTTPDELEPLYTVVDPDALEQLFAPTAAGNTRTDGQIMFTYGGYHVTVTSDGIVDIAPIDEKTE